MNDSEIKDLLGRAIGEEPSLGISRDEVFTAGRRMVRRRRAFAAGGAVAAVVLAAVGAATLTNLVDGPPPLPPAASRTLHAPPGPELPLPGASTPLAPSTTETTNRPSASGVADRLTQQLLQNDLVRQNHLRLLADVEGPPRFNEKGRQYVFRSDVQVGDRQGELQITIDPTDNSRKSICEQVGPPYSACVITEKDGVQVAQATAKTPTGEQTELARGVLPNGLLVEVVVSNQSSQGNAPQGPPVLDPSAMLRLIVKSGFSVS